MYISLFSPHSSYSHSQSRFVAFSFVELYTQTYERKHTHTLFSLCPLLNDSFLTLGCKNANENRFVYLLSTKSNPQCTNAYINTFYFSIGATNRKEENSLNKIIITQKAKNFTTHTQTQNRETNEKNFWFHQKKRQKFNKLALKKMCIYYINIDGYESHFHRA